VSEQVWVRRRNGSNVPVVRILQRLTALAGLAVVALVLADSPNVMVAIAAVALAAVLASRYAAVAIRSRVLTVGSRASAHRESFSSTPEPAHPDTAGRTRSRAPSPLVTAA